MSTSRSIAGGDINPARFLMHSTAADFRVLQATANAVVMGVSGRWTRTTPYAGIQDTKHAVAGEDVEIIKPPDEAQLELGGTVTRGDLLKSDANGKGITAGSGENGGARAKESGVNGDIISVELVEKTLA